MHLDYKKGVLPPTEKLTLSIFPTPAWRVKSGLIRRAQGAPAIGRGKPLPKIGFANTSIPTERKFSPVFRTHAIASQAQSHRLKPNLTRLDRNSLRSFRKLKKWEILQNSGVDLKKQRIRKNNRILYSLGDRRNWQSQSPKEATPLLKNSRSEQSELLSRRVSSGRGLNCRPLWHFCKQKSPITSQFPHGFGF